MASRRASCWHRSCSATRIVELDEHTHRAREYAGNYHAYRTSKLEEQGRREREYERQQEEIRELRRVVRTSGRQVSHNRPPTDNDKFAHHFFGERVEQAVSRNVRAAEERLRRIEADPAPKPPRPLRINSLDILEKLEEALAQFPGPIVAVSHDRWFVECFGGTTYELRDGRLTPHHAPVLVDTGTG